MSVSALTAEQEAFLEECALEFSDRFTDADLDYKRIYDQGIPDPPIMCPWYGRGRFNNRDRGGDNRYNDRRDYRSGSDNYRERDRNYYKERRYRPY